MTISTSVKPLVFVTGASGYIGYQIVFQLLAAGYRVRGAARGAKVERLRVALKQYGDAFEAVDVPDVASGNLSQFLQGAHAVIHTASPLMGKTDPETAFRTAVEGSLHILEEAYKLGVKRFVVTGSIASSPWGGPFGENIWNEATKEEAFASKVPGVIYRVQKKIGEQAVIKFAEEHPDTRVAIFCPPFVYGPFAPGFEHIVGVEGKQLVADGKRPLSTTEHIYGLLNPDSKTIQALQPWYFIDVRDLARAHIAALHLDESHLVPLPAPRLLIVAPEMGHFGDALEIIRKERPELASRLMDGSFVPEVVQGHDATVGLPHVEKVTGIKKTDYRTFKETLLDTVDSLIALERWWAENEKL